jgi:hypothetical protein
MHYELNVKMSYQQWLINFDFMRYCEADSQKQIKENRGALLRIHQRIAQEWCMGYGQDFKYLSSNKTLVLTQYLYLSGSMVLSPT